MNPEQQKVFDELDKSGIRYEVIFHPPVFTIEEADALHLDGPGTMLKNLFLRDAKGKRFFLVSMKEEKRADLRALQARLGCSRLSFASEQRLMEMLGLRKGSVTPMGLLNDETNVVEFFLDDEVAPETNIGVHPNDNAATVYLRMKDLERLLTSHGHAVHRIKI
jgi:Ala-tRNA(Pro) deacylase